MKNNLSAASITEGLKLYLHNIGRQDLLPEIIRLLQDIPGQKTSVVVQSASPLSSSQQSQVIDLLKQNFAVTSPIEFMLKPELIGGLRVTIGDQVLDLSVSGRLKQIYAQT